MKKYLKVHSTVRPEEKKVDDYSVWISTNIHEISVSTENGESHTEYEYDLTQYSKDEFILLALEDIQTTQSTIEDALCELDAEREVV